MTVGLNVPQWVQDADPVFVFGASPRCGTTLLQRLLNSSHQIVVFGENAHFVKQIPDMVASLLANHVEHGEGYEKIRRKFQHETTEFWSNNLWPDSRRYAIASVSYFYDLANIFRGSARAMGRGRWGVKQPLDHPNPLKALCQLLPGAKFLFVHRNIFDVVRSAKGRYFVTNPAECARYAQRWQNCIVPALQGEFPPCVQLIRYEDMVAQPDTHIDAIEAFCGIQGIDRAVMERKINTFIGTNHERQSPTGYKPPRELTDDEVAAIEQAAPRGIELARCVNDAARAA